MGERLTASPRIVVSQLKDRRYAAAQKETGDWVDVKVIGYFKNDGNQHLFEIQVVHKKMWVAREKMGGHEAFAKYRSFSEAIEFIKQLHGQPGKYSDQVAALELKLEEAQRKVDPQGCNILRTEI